MCIRDSVHRRVFREVNDTNLLDSHNQTMFSDSSNKFAVYSSVSLDLNENVSHSTESYSSTTLTTKRTPKPKPKLTNGAKLDHTRNWENVPVGKPPKEDLIPVTLSPSSTSVPLINSSHSFQRNISSKTLSVTDSYLSVLESTLNVNTTSSLNLTGMNIILPDSLNNIDSDNQPFTTHKNVIKKLNVTVDRNKNILFNSPQVKGNIFLYPTEGSKSHLQDTNVHANREGVKMCIRDRARSVLEVKKAKDDISVIH